ncbi:hypothetical protein JZ751_007865 [Albula glossodonta]|uniref:Uncharacterized protein n=1 Tax=Albula glossodonta TaxID=121402 RepID=A0A8T2P142_9TELE|nr:hypothetical protein JZ751_007865 [Albula glossodonta]
MSAPPSTETWLTVSETLTSVMKYYPGRNDGGKRDKGATQSQTATITKQSSASSVVVNQSIGTALSQLALTGTGTPAVCPVLCTACCQASDAGKQSVFLMEKVKGSTQVDSDRGDRITAVRREREEKGREKCGGRLATGTVLGERRVLIGQEVEWRQRSWMGLAVSSVLRGECWRDRVGLGEAGRGRATGSSQPNICGEVEDEKDD